MTSSLTFKINARKDKEGKEFHEVTLKIPGLKPTKLTKASGETNYPNRGGALTAVKNWGKKYGFEVSEETKEVVAATAAPKKIAAKRSAAKTKEDGKCETSGTCCWTE